MATSKLRSLGRSLAALIPDGLALPILAGPLRGKRWIAGAAAGEGRGLSVLFNQCEAEMLQCAERIISPGSVIFDLGANVGIYSLLFSKYALKVYAFEPAVRNLHYLWDLLHVNKITNVIPVPLAVCEEQSLLGFDPGANSALGHLSQSGVWPVGTTSLDMFCAWSKVVPSLIKIDVEGAEMRVLQGAQRLLREHHPDLLLCTHSTELNNSCRSMLKLLDYSFEELSTDGSAVLARLRKAGPFRVSLQ